MNSLQIDFLSDDEGSRGYLAAKCSGAVLTEPMFLAGDVGIISIVVTVSLATIPHIFSVIKTHLENKRYIKLKLPGGVEIIGLSVPEIEQLLTTLAKDQLIERASSTDKNGPRGGSR